MKSRVIFFIQMALLAMAVCVFALYPVASGASSSSKYEGRELNETAPTDSGAGARAEADKALDAAGY